MQRLSGRQSKQVTGDPSKSDVWVCMEHGRHPGRLSAGVVEPRQDLPVGLDLKPLTSEKQQCVRDEEKHENQETSNEQAQMSAIIDIQERNVAIIQPY